MDSMPAGSQAGGDVHRNDIPREDARGMTPAVVESVVDADSYEIAGWAYAVREDSSVSWSRGCQRSIRDNYFRAMTGIGGGKTELSAPRRRKHTV